MPQTSSELPDFFARHRALLERAVAAITARDHWTPYPESPSTSVYGEDAAKLGEAAFEERLGGHFELAGHPGDGRVAAGETSPYGFELGISYSATLSDPAFVTGRFATLQSRRPAPAEETTDA
ncbi:hypothetical protein [Streptomyces sp. NPDC088847]|uniref:hypothetical protein n=1 Tax=Streptomyces sp. NPDC088847 TaxID=3365909 RepID=UPI0037F3A5F4